jgi:outer membrane receptor protein involved in Fe transport
MRQQMMTFRLSVLSAALFFQPVAWAFSDEEEIEKIEVKGELLPTTAQTATNSVDVLNKELFAKLGASHIQDVLMQLGNVNYASGSSRARFFQIRGIGERSQFVDPVNPSVGIAIDGIDYTGIGNAATLFDIEQVEVFKGPQGTNIGANAMAGFINLSSTAPGSGQDPRLRLEAGNYGFTHIAGAYGAELGKRSAFRISASKVDGNGYIENDYLDRDDTNGFDELVIRTALNTKVNRDLSIQAALHKIDIDNGYDAFSLDNNRTTLSDEPGFDRQDTTALALTSLYTGSDKADVKFFLSHSTSDLAYGYDEDWAYGQYNEDWSFTGIHPDGYSSTDHYYRDQSTNQLDVTLRDKDKDWVLGVYLQDKQTELTRQYTWLAQDFSSDFNVSNYALYGERRHALTKEVTFAYGLRFEQYEGDYTDSNGIKETVDDSMWGGHITGSKIYNNGFMSYFRISRGFKSGGVNGEALARVGEAGLERFVTELQAHGSFRPEVLNNVELGMRFQSKNRRLKANATLFYSDRDNMQIKQWLTNDKEVQENGDQPIFVGFLSNTPTGSNYGAETSASFVVNPSFTVYGGLALLETEVSNFKRLQDEQLVTIDGRAQAHAPSYQYHLGFDWQITERISFNTNLTGRDEYFYSFTHDEVAKPVDLLNASLVYRGSLFDVTLWARNITDEEYGVRGFYFGNDPRDGYAAKSYEQFGEPRVFGVTVDYIF